jgi:hypothetical protein
VPSWVSRLILGPRVFFFPCVLDGFFCGLFLGDLLVVLRVNALHFFNKIFTYQKRKKKRKKKKEDKISQENFYSD